MISQHWFSWWLGAIRQQALTWANANPDLCHHTRPQWVNYYICSLWPSYQFGVGAAPMGDAPTTSEWSTTLLPTKVQLILEVWRYIHLHHKYCTEMMDKSWFYMRNNISTKLLGGYIGFTLSVRPSVLGILERFYLLHKQADVQLDEVTPVAGGLTLHSCYCN